MARHHGGQRGRGTLVADRPAMEPAGITTGKRQTTPSTPLLLHQPVSAPHETPLFQSATAPRLCLCLRQNPGARRRWAKSPGPGTRPPLATRAVPAWPAGRGRAGLAIREVPPHSQVPPIPPPQSQPSPRMSLSSPGYSTWFSSPGRFCSDSLVSSCPRNRSQRRSGSLLPARCFGPSPGKAERSENTH